MRDGVRVEGHPAVSQDGLSAEFIHDGALAPQTKYSIEVTSLVRDTDGDAVATPFLVTFTTEGVKPEAAGLELIFTRREDGQVYTIRLDGSGLKRITDGGRNERPAWSPDGSRIAFARNFPGRANNGFGTSDIFLMNSSGLLPARRTLDANYRSVEWSPDGLTLAVSDEGNYYAEIWVMGTDDGSSPVRIATDARTPAWSPDGKKIAFVRTSWDDGYHQIFVMNPDGSGQTPLTELDPGGIYGLDWSPDGSRIAFSKCLSPLGCNIYVMNADGSGLAQITGLGNLTGAAEWSPDGEWIAVTQNTYSGRDWLPSVGYIPAKGGALHIVSSGYWPSWRPLAR
jgi:TolB protein